MEAPPQSLMGHTLKLPVCWGHPVLPWFCLCPASSASQLPDWSSEQSLKEAEEPSGQRWTEFTQWLTSTLLWAGIEGLSGMGWVALDTQDGWLHGKLGFSGGHNTGLFIHPPHFCQATGLIQGRA